MIIDIYKGQGTRTVRRGDLFFKGREPEVRSRTWSRSVMKDTIVRAPSACGRAVVEEKKKNSIEQSGP